MVSQKEVKTALYELGGKATMREIAELLFAKKQIQDPTNTSPISRILQSLKSWKEVDKILYRDKNHPKDNWQDVWIIKK